MKMLNTIKFLVVCIPLLFPCLAIAGQSQGEGLWKSLKCGNCHRDDMKKKVGPGLSGLFQRTDEQWVKAWLADPVSTWKANEGYTSKLREAMNKQNTPKPSHKTKKLSENEITSLIEYIKTFQPPES